MKTKLSWLETVLLTAPFVALAIYWNDLPARVPIHWNFRGQIDGWSSENAWDFHHPAHCLGVTALLRVLPWFDPRLRRTLGDESRDVCRPPDRSCSRYCSYSTRFFSSKSRWR